MFSLVCYLSLFSVMLMTVYVSNNNRTLTIQGSQNNIPLLCCIIFAVFFGARYDVGIDYLAYLEQYEAMLHTHDDRNAFMEFGFMFITRFFAFNGFHFFFYFSFLAFIQILCVFLALKEESRIFYFLVFTLIFNCTFLSWMNGTRQELAFCFFAISITYMVKRRLMPFLLLGIIAISMHKSAFIILPLYFLFAYKKKPYCKSIKVQLSLLVCSLVAMLNNPIGHLLSFFSAIAPLFGYDNYYRQLETGDLGLLFSEDKERGLGFLTILVLHILLIVNSNKVKDYFKSRKLEIMYDLFFAGVIYGYISNGSIMFGRINYYFIHFDFIIGAFTLYYLYKVRSRGRLFYFLSVFSLYIILFIAVLTKMEENKSLFNFFWQIN